MKGGFQQMMKQAQQMQRKMEKMQEELADLEVTASVGGGMIVATANGAQKLVNIKIDPEVVDPDPEEIEMLQDLIVAAVNEALRQAEEKKQEEMGKIMPPGMAGGLGGLGNLF